jgi:hypothetical protein
MNGIRFEGNRFIHSAVRLLHVETEEIHENSIQKAGAPVKIQTEYILNASSDHPAESYLVGTLLTFS